MVGVVALRAVFKTLADKNGQLVYHHGMASFPLVNRELFGPSDLIGKIAVLWSTAHPILY